MTFREHDGGRQSAGFRGRAGDCGVRAAAIATGRGYREVYDDLFERQKTYQGASRRRTLKARAASGRSASPRGGVWAEVLGPYLIEAGAQWVALSGIGQSPIRVKDIATRWPNRRLVMRLARHFSAMVDGMNLDTWAQHPEKRVYGVWLMPGNP